MPLPQEYAKGVLFVGRRPPGKPEFIAGTGFLVQVDSDVMSHDYVVTAAHVVDGIDDTFVRFRATNGDVVEVDVPDWINHGEHDVAVAPIELEVDSDVRTTGLDQFVDTPGALDGLWGPIELGDVIYFIGLLGKIEAMVDQNTPIVRAGFLGALWQEQVPVKRSRIDETTHITAHLIDCRSFAGFSGSPCYLQKSRVKVIADPEDGTVGVADQWRTLLFGLIGGHFDDWTGIQQRRDEAEDYAISDDVRAPVSTGVGYVIPAEFIRETLMRDELVGMRLASDKDFLG